MYLASAVNSNMLFKQEDTLSLTAKIFIHNNANEAVIELNEWLKSNKVDVQHICQSQSEKGGKFIFIMTLFYRKIF